MKQPSTRQSAAQRERLNARVDELVKRQRQKARRAFERHERKREPKAARIIAYDLETTAIRANDTPRPLYLTAYSRSEPFLFDGAIRDMRELRRYLKDRFLTDELRGVKFVAWNGNRFDAYFIAAALVGDEEFVLRPYMTRSHALRGLRVNRAEDSPKTKGWEFLDGIAMLGLEGVSLEKLLRTFAPDHEKLVGAVDFESGEEFDPGNEAHRAYALRDSVGLWHAMTRAQSILLEHFRAPLAVTMGGACIKIFQAHIPRDVTVRALDPGAESVFRDYVMRGGYCYCARRYVGPVWKYDINQAYAAAMRESPMPCGAVIYNPNGIHSSARVYVADIEAWNPRNRVAFYYRTLVGGRVRSSFATDHIARTWLTSIEIEQLRAEGWRIQAHGAYQWAESFTMQEYVDRLERLRTTCEGGPSGAIGTMVKATGNHSYGKTVEESSPLEFRIASVCPDGFEPFFDSEGALLEHVFFRFEDDARDKDYHAVQLGAFITASVRMKVRRAALIAPESWLYADTDCVIFDRDVTARLDIDAKRYGAWKIEETGTPYRIIAKKVYAEVLDDASAKPKKRSAKGLNVKRLTDDDFARWFAGIVPVQEQVQRNNFLATMQGAQMFRAQVRKGTRIEAVDASPKS